MRPTASLVTFTTSSGAGYGLFSIAALRSAERGVTDTSLALIEGVIGLVLITIGLLASTGHLANPRNAIKAFNRVRTSWLSREGVFSLLFYLPALAWLILLWQGASGPWLTTAAWLAAALALITVICTGMIYASLKTIPQWHSPLVPVAFILVGGASGAVLDHAIRLFGGSGETGLMVALALLGAALLVKLIYYAWIGQPNPAGPSRGTAVGVTQAQVRLMESGHSHANFLTREFDYRMRRASRLGLRTLALGLGFVVPLGLLVWAPQLQLSAALAVASLALGVAAERWLFLAEGQHVVNFYQSRAVT